MSNYNYDLLTSFLNIVLETITLKGIDNINGTLMSQQMVVKFDDNGKKNVEKEYIVGITGKLSVSQKCSLEKGILINGERTASAKIKLIPSQSDIEYSVTINEGKKRQIRLMFMAAGLKVISIKRVRILNLILDKIYCNHTFLFLTTTQQSINFCFYLQFDFYFYPTPARTLLCYHYLELSTNAPCP